jgi:hypothetical protein
MESIHPSGIAAKPAETVLGLVQMFLSDLMMTTTQGAKTICRFGAPRVQLAWVNRDAYR